jgi:hypothetical protein
VASRVPSLSDKRASPIGSSIPPAFSRFRSPSFCFLFHSIRREPRSGRGPHAKAAFSSSTTSLRNAWEWGLSREELITTRLRKRFAHRSVAITFDPAPLAFICQPEGSEDTLEVPIQGISKAQLMGELAELQALPIYQLALPFSVAAWRQLEYAHHLTGTTW